MKINRISWQNYRGLADGEIVTDGQDVIITGHNGAGKSSIASILPFVLFAKGASSVKQFDAGFIPNDDGLIHSAEIEFDDGTVLRREYSWIGKSNRHVLFVNGKPVKSDEWHAHIFDLTLGLSELSFNPFEFCEMPAAERRGFLIAAFGSDIQIDSSTVNDILAGLSPEKFLADANRELKQLKKDADKIPVKIDENKRILKNFPADIDKAIRDLQTQIDKDVAKRDKLRNDQDFNFQLALAQTQLSRAQRQVDSLNVTRQKLLDEFRALKNSKCPTCGQPIVPDNARLQTIVNDGKKVSADIKDFQQKVDDAQKQVSELSVKAKDNLFGSELELLNDSINAASNQLAKLQTAKDARARIDELYNSAASINDEINRLNQDIQAVKDFAQLKIERIEDHINSQFEFVSWKLFNVAITTGEITPTCEPTLHGVPFSALSKGEKLKAALDIFTALQRHHGVNLPIFLDDAESYTANSFVDLPNQLWLFKVTEEPKLNIKIVPKS